MKIGKIPTGKGGKGIGVYKGEGRIVVSKLKGKSKK
jgi:hypothetical protein